MSLQLAPDATIDDLCLFAWRVLHSLRAGGPVSSLAGLGRTSTTGQRPHATKIFAVEERFQAAESQLFVGPPGMQRVDLMMSRPSGRLALITGSLQRSGEQ